MHRKTVIITGASSGIGLALAKAYLDEGFNVVGNARTLARLQQAQRELGSPENFAPAPGDIAEPGTARKIFETAVARFGQVQRAL